MNTPVILASQSAQRKKLLAATGLEFSVVPADIDEKTIASPILSDRAKSIAVAKAAVVARLHPESIIIAADSFVVLNQEIFEKPRDLTEARRMLEKLSGQTVIEHTGVCYLDPVKQTQFSTTITTQATFRRLSPQEIDRYLSTQPVLTWSGAFSPAYDAGMALIDTVTGSLTSFTHGFPMEVIMPLLQASQVL
jgi:septum formation protein